MRILLLIGFLSVFGAPLKAQFIVAGQHATTDYYVDIPDTTLHVTPYNSPKFTLDINGDGVMDFDITIKWSQSQASKLYYIALNARDSNQIAFGCFDSCSNSEQPVLGNDPMALAVAANDTIDGSAVWQYYAYQYLNFTSYVGWGSTYTSCNGGQFSSVSSFLGVRVFAVGDTLYGWIKVTVVGTSDCTIYEYACNSVNAGVSVINSDATLHIYPNPASSLLTVEVNSNKHAGMIQLQILNSLGQKVYETQVIANQRNRIELSSIRKGVYTVQLLDGQTGVHKKFVKQ